jgi:hypothetical protein
MKKTALLFFSSKSVSKDLYMMSFILCKRFIQTSNREIRGGVWKEGVEGDRGGGGGGGERVEGRGGWRGTGVGGGERGEGVEGEGVEGAWLHTG